MVGLGTGKIMEARKKEEARSKSISLQATLGVFCSNNYVSPIISYLPNRPIVLSASSRGDSGSLIFSSRGDSGSLLVPISPSLHHSMFNLSTIYSQSLALNSLCCKYLKTCLFSCRNWLILMTCSYTISLCLCSISASLSSRPVLSHPLRLRSTITYSLMLSQFLHPLPLQGWILLHISFIISDLFLETTTDLIFLRTSTLSYSTWYCKRCECLLNEWLNA